MAKIGKALVKLTKEITKAHTNKNWKRHAALAKLRAPMKEKIHKSEQKYFKNAEQRSEAFNEKVIKDKKHIAGRFKQVTRSTDRLKRNTAANKAKGK